MAPGRVPSNAPQVPGETTSSFCRRRARSAIEDHFHIDIDTFSLLGPLHHDPNLSRDIHDWYNILALPPLVVLNALNWRLTDKDALLAVVTFKERLPSLWHDAWFEAFMLATLLYFVIDGLWVIVVPNCVRSPSTIVQHHVATLAFLAIPLLYPEYRWLMGACMSVEVNTWFLIARRLFNKEGRTPFTFSVDTPGGPIKVKTVSVLFYMTWVFFRLILYPSILPMVLQAYFERWELVGSPFNVIIVAPVLQSAFIYLNLKWSFDLFYSKFRGHNSVKKGL